MSWQLASFLLLGAALAGGFAWFERSRPSSRTIALVATLAALATLGRIAFAPIPNVKPTTDIVLIAGYTLGGAPGFAVGAVAAIASNIFFGEGPWTPWEMLAWGLVGLSGAAIAYAVRRFSRGEPRVPRVVMALVCFVAGFGYGVIVDCYQWLGYTNHSLASYAAIEASSFAFNLAHAVGNFLFYLAFGPLLVRALLRFRARLEVNWGVAGLVVALVLLVGAGARVGAANLTPARADMPSAAIRAGLRYLTGAQNRDGGFGAAVGQPSAQIYTAWAVIGISAAGGDVDALRREGHSPVTYIQAHLGALQGVGDVERTVLALATADAPLQRLRVRLLHDQSTNGSFGGQVNLTAFGMLALRAAHAPGVARAARWLEKQQNADGGFSYAARSAPSDADDTAAAVEALVAGGVRETVIARAVAYLRSQQDRDGGFPDQPGAPSDAQSTAWVVQAFVAAGVDPDNVDSRGRSDPVTYLERLQGPAGAFDYAAGNVQTPVWVTAQVLAALARRPL